MFKPRVLLLYFFLALSIAWASSSGLFKGAETLSISTNCEVKPTVADRQQRMHDKAADAEAFAALKGYNTTICFLVDMSISSGQNRFFVYDLRQDSLRKSGLVAHGRCNQNWLEGRQYGNSVGCGCTSLGKYRIGHSYIGRFGLAFKLYGLEKTNDQAFDRFVVLHSHGCVPAVEVTDEICQSDGCPMVSPSFLLYLQTIIEGSDKPVLLWIYD